MNQFLQLLFDHAKEQHAVTFYAGKLFITPQYLSLILKELTGKSANKWIEDALIVEAKVLLKMPQTTVQQVADKLNFSDQSTFGKFFKKHIGLSPMEYRKS
jgi:AraC-like DNA-binding protein